MPATNNNSKINHNKYTAIHFTVNNKLPDVLLHAKGELGTEQLQPESDLKIVPDPLRI